MVKSCNYYSQWKAAVYRCSQCDWNGAGEECVQGELLRTEVEMYCPKCKELLFYLSYPTDDEIENNMEKLSEEEKIDFMQRNRREQEFSQNRLNFPEQLPDIEDDNIVLAWDMDDNNYTLIKYGDQLIWKEPARYEGYERFMEVASILKDKYQDKLRDLIPAPKSELYLYGDHGPSPQIIENVRIKLRKN